MENLSVLIGEIKDGNPNAFEPIVQHFQDMAVGYGYAILGDLQSAEDAAQEAFINAYLDLYSLNDPKAFPGWFRRIVVKQIDRIRRRGRASISIDQLPNLMSEHGNPVAMIELQEVQDAVSGAILALPELQREVVTLYYIGEYSQQEVSEFLDVPLSTIKMRLYHARQQLKQQLVSLIIEYLPHKRPSRDSRFMEKIMSYPVQTKEVPAQKIISITRQSFIRDLQAHLDGGVKTLTIYAQTLGTRVVGLPLAIYYGPVREDQHSPVEICLPVEGDIPPSLEIAVKELPATQVAYTVATLRQSIYPGVLKAHEAIEQWIISHGHQVIGSSREIYLNFNQSIFSPTASLDDPCIEVARPYQ